jgi:3-methyladenine DNA glycosylase AlkD
MVKNLFLGNKVKLTMNKHHQILLDHLENKANGKKDGSSYMGTEKIKYDIRVPEVRKIVKQFSKKHDLSPKEFKELLISLSQGNIHQEFWIIGDLLKFYKNLRPQLDLSVISQILNKTQGWGEVDTVCYNTFTYQNLLNNWGQWHQFLVTLRNSDNIHQRRASLVLLTAPVRYSDDPKLSKLAFKNIEQLKKEDHKLITKAVSWLLRELIKQHRQEVKKYLKENKNSLPAIAVRETTNKLETGKK